jgi:RNA polymerase sigma-70 factor, ECF subfamily
VIIKKPGLEEKLAIARLKQGELDGMETLVKRYQIQAVYAAYLLVRDPHLAEDIVQEAFLHAAEKIAQFDAERPFGPWFLRSVINAATKRAKQQERFVPLDAADDDEISVVAAWLVDPDPSPEAVVETQETQQMVWSALGKLTPEQRAAIILRHFLDMSEAEMTQELKRPLTTIRWRLKTARNQRRKFLQAFWQADYQELQDEN